jgi:hypothetical protein
MLIGSRRSRTALGSAVLAATLLAGCQNVPSPLRNPPFRAGDESPEDAAKDSKDSKLTPTAALAPADRPAVDIPLPQLPRSSEPSTVQPAAEPTPMLDAAFARAQAQKRALLGAGEPLPSSDPVSLEPGPPAAESPRSAFDPANAADPTSPAPTPVALESEAATVTPPSSDDASGGPGERTDPRSSFGVTSAFATGPASSTVLPRDPAMPADPGRHTGPVRNDVPEAATPPSSDPVSPGVPSPEPTPAEDTSAAASGSISKSPADASAVPEPNAAESLAINDLRLCRRVLGFGNVEPLDASACKVGQAIIVYSEMAGVSWKRQGDKYLARLASDVQVLPADSDQPLWQQSLGTADDTCARRRQDFFVSDRLTLPDNLPPGNYRLRLIQKDLIAERATSATLSFTIQP